ncbi:hypothetical protein H4R24_002938 [Coemansia sp. RSA 988]|nr:hypothetical protein H4R24_002938 [Coemansia sp. RSA 988]
MGDIQTVDQTESSDTSSRFIPLKAMEHNHAAEVMLSWKDLNYKVPTVLNGQKVHRTILSSISGEARAGEAIALIGSSGAGKTTLLNALSGRIVGGHLTGSILYRGAKRHPGTFKRITSFVQQDDLMHPLLTVDETLTYASKLRLSNSEYSPYQKAERVNEAIRQLRLEAARNTRIGNASTRGVSGGERKRVSIGAELLTDPHLLFLDEPTSGLDSNSSEMVVELVKSIAVERGIATLVTIHQPSAHIFNMFDKVILLSQGRVVYFGPTSSVISYFGDLGHQCPMHENPADYFVRMMTLDYRSEDALAKSKEQVKELADVFAAYSSSGSNKSGNKKQTDNLSAIESEASGKMDLSRNSWMYEYTTLARRDWLNIFRNVNYCVSQVLQPIVMGLLIGFMYYYLEDNALGVQNRLGVLYIILVQGTFPIFFPPLALFSAELNILTRERSVAAYRLTSYYVSKTTTFIPLVLISNTPFYIAVYFISRLTIEASKFFVGLGIFYALNAVFVTFMLLFGAAVQPIEVAYVLSTAAITVQLLFNGFFVNFHSVTVVLKWLRWLNPIYYTFAALVQNEMKGKEFTCEPNMQCYSNGDQVISSYDLDHFNIWQCVLLLLMLGSVFYASGYAFLRWKAKPKYIWI